MLRLNWAKIGAALGFLSVALGAFGAHILKTMLTDDLVGVFETAVQYQFFHALALVFVGVLQKQFPEKNFDFAGLAFLVGVVLFSMSLYLLALTGVKWLGAVTPFGGVSFLAGWAIMFLQIPKR